MLDSKRHRFEKDIVLTCVRWYLAYPLSCRHLEEMMEERGVPMDHSNSYRCWVQKFTPQLEGTFGNGKKRPVGKSWRMDETYISGNYYPDTPLIYPYRLDRGIHAADGPNNSFQIYISRFRSSGNTSTVPLIRQGRRLTFCSPPIAIKSRTALFEASYPTPRLTRERRSPSTATASIQLLWRPCSKKPIACSKGAKANISIIQ